MVSTTVSQRLTVSNFDTPISISMLSNSPPIGSGQRGKLVNCGLAKRKCPGGGGHVCVISRGDTTFEEKAISCQRSGGVAALIYNNAFSALSFTLATPSQVTIPVFSTTLTNGQYIVQNFLGRNGSFSLTPGYSPMSGTSMVSTVKCCVWLMFAHSDVAFQK